tara:strand:- start:594 stop:1445 length:852 start_codon:yes stop_codon:yes gene_type:complete
MKKFIIKEWQDKNLTKESRITELEFDSQEAFAKYKAKHDVQPDTQVSIGGKETTAGEASGEKEPETEKTKVKEPSKMSRDDWNELSDSDPQKAEDMAWDMAGDIEAATGMEEGSLEFDAFDGRGNPVYITDDGEEVTVDAYSGNIKGDYGKTLGNFNESIKPKMKKFIIKEWQDKYLNEKKDPHPMDLLKGKDLDPYIDDLWDDGWESVDISKAEAKELDKKYSSGGPGEIEQNAFTRGEVYFSAPVGGDSAMVTALEKKGKKYYILYKDDKPQVVKKIGAFK